MMNLSCLILIAPFLISSQSFAMSLSDAVSGGGALQVITAQTISGTNFDGDPAYLQQVVYQGSYRSILPRAPSDSSELDGTKLSCMGVFDTGGSAVTIPAGTVLQWNTDELAGDRYDTFTLDDTTYEEVRLLFYGDNSKFTEMDCSLTYKSATIPPVLTLDDFAAATGGQMILIPSAN